MPPSFDDITISDLLHQCGWADDARVPTEYRVAALHVLRETLPTQVSRLETERVATGDIPAVRRGLLLLCASEFLQRLCLTPGSAESVQIAGIQVSKSRLPEFAERYEQAADSLLHAYLRHPARAPGAVAYSRTASGRPNDDERF